MTVVMRGILKHLLAIITLSLVGRELLDGSLLLIKLKSEAEHDLVVTTRLSFHEFT
jgi:hypothetical protein